MSTLSAILDRLTGLDGVRVVILAGRDGLPIAQSPHTFDSAEPLAAFGANALSTAIGLGAATQRTALIGVVCEYQDALVSIDPLGEMATTVALIDAAAALVPLRQTLRQLRGELLAALDAM